MSLPPTFVSGFHDENAVRKMRYNKLGNSDLQLSHLGFGGAGLADFYEQFDEAVGIKVLQEALKRGVNYIDTAAYYGEGRKSERIIGKALKGIPREAYYIGTKVGRFSPDLKNGFDFSYDATLRSVDKSLELLGLSYVDIIQAHDIEFIDSLDVVINETLPALAAVVSAGKARYIGVTGYPISVLKEAIEKSKVKVDCVLCYARSTLHDDTLLDFLPFFQSRGLGVISAAGTSMGLLTNRGPFSFHPGHPEMKEECAKASNYCKDSGVELGRLAVHHSMSVKGPSTHLLGMCSLQVLEDNLDVCLNGINQKEQEALQYVKTNFIDRLTKRHWEGVEIANRRAAIAALDAK